MSILFTVKLYLIAFFAFLGIDAVWLTKISPGFYKNNIGNLLAEKPNLVAAAVFYILNIVGILIFAVIPAVQINSPKTALIYGALFGFFTYATYDLTNYATLKDWPINVVLVDILWGTILTATVAFITYYFGTKLG